MFELVGGCVPLRISGLRFEKGVLSSSNSGDDRSSSGDGESCERVRASSSSSSSEAADDRDGEIIRAVERPSGESDGMGWWGQVVR